MVEPITDVQWGKANWTDFENNWREVDAEYLQSRGVLRYQTGAARDAALGAAPAGQVVYNNETDKLEWRSNGGTWKSVLPMPANLAVPQDTVGGVSLAHGLAAGKGILFGPD